MATNRSVATTFTILITSETRGIVVPILSLSKHVGFRKSLQAVALFLKLHLQTKRYKKKYWLHGDVAVRNMYYQQQTNDLFFIDFENVYFTRKWPLLEIIQRCFCYGGGVVKSFSFELDSLNQYLFQAKEHDNLELSNSNLFNQFRLSLFLSTISRIVRPKSKDKSTAFTLLLNVILNEKAFRTFYQKNIASLLADSPKRCSSISIEELKDILKNNR